MGNASIWEIRGKVGGGEQEKLEKKEKNEKWLEIQDWNASMKRKKRKEKKLIQELEEKSWKNKKRKRKRTFKMEVWE